MIIPMVPRECRPEHEIIENIKNLELVIEFLWFLKKIISMSDVKNARFHNYQNREYMHFIIESVDGSISYFDKVLMDHFEINQ
jgi:hypothetical protein